MQKRTALAVATGLVLMVAGAMSAFALTLRAHTATGGGSGAEADTVVVTEYVDEAGNPIASPSDVASPDPELIVVELGSDATETIVVAADAGTFAFDSTFGSPTGTADQTGSWYDDDDEGWDDEGDEYEYEDEHEDEHEEEHEEEHGDD